MDLFVSVFGQSQRLRCVSRDETIDSSVNIGTDIIVALSAAVVIEDVVVGAPHHA